MSNNHPIKFYNESLSTSYHLNQVQDFIYGFEHNKIDFTLNDIIEIYNVLKYLDSTEFDTEYLNKDFKISARKTIGIYFSDRELSSLTEEYQSLYSAYKEDFWEVFVNFNMINRTTASQLEDFLKGNQIYLGCLLTQKAIRKKYNTVLKNRLLKEPKYFELFLRKYDSAIDENYDFPKSFTNDDINNWARRYCEMPNANANYLNQLSQWSLHHDYIIEDKVILKAKRVHKNILSTLFKEEQGFSWGIEVSIKPDVEKIVDFQLSKSHLYHIYFDKNWLDSERDYPTLLNNFIYVFQFFNKFNSFSLIGNQYEAKSLFEMIKIDSKHSYNTTLDFDIKRSMYSLIFLAYYDYLAFNDIDIEELFGYCYNQYFKNEYNIDQFFFTASFKGNDYYSRAKFLIPEMDGILKQFAIYQEEGEIDLELFELRSKPTNYISIKSLIEKKFVYYNSEKVINICRLLFSDKSTLSHTINKDRQKPYSLYELVLEGIKLTDFHEIQRGIITNSLKENNIVEYNLSNQIYFKDINVITIYKYIWDAGYLSLLLFPKKYLKIIDEEVQSGNLRYGNTLFSEQESEYISYVMDNKKFSNGLEIRNKLTHGNYTKKSLNEHKNYYLELLMILMLFTFRINEELNYEDLNEEI